MYTPGIFEGGCRVRRRRKMGSGSAGIRRIPEERRCEIAGQLATFLSVIYDLAFREVTDDFEQREREIWIEVGKEVPQLAGTCRLRSSDAPGIADTISVVRETALRIGVQIRGPRSLPRHRSHPYEAVSVPHEGTGDGRSSRTLLSPVPRLLCHGDRTTESEIYAPVRSGDVHGGPELRVQDSTERYGCR